jgi:hypothetical protein
MALLSSAGQCVARENLPSIFWMLVFNRAAVLMTKGASMDGALM